MDLDRYGKDNEDPNEKADLGQRKINPTNESEREEYLAQTDRHHREQKIKSKK
ncbi:unnamed protein product [marine sediment metagenome]|uniref:Uncharacterized protein n=1 Tax=marine sediment metagenome TaxID=412755 RepID=X1B2H1_9ZZZZ